MKKISNINFYDAQEVAELVGLHLDTIRRFLREKKIVGKKIGTKWYVRKKEIMKLYKDED